MARRRWQAGEGAAKGGEAHGGDPGHLGDLVGPGPGGVHDVPCRLAAALPMDGPSRAPLDPLYRVTSSWWGSAFVVPLITAWVSDARVSSAVGEVFTPQTAPEGYAAHFGPGLTLRRITMRANAVQRANLLEEIKAQVPRYGEIAVPTEILHGTADTTVNLSIHSEKLVTQIPGSVLTLLEGIGHMPQHVAVPQVLAAVERAAARAGLR